MESNQFVYLLSLAFAVMLWWILFHKAGKPGWYAIVPLLNVVAIIHLAGRRWWWIILFFIPLVNIVAVIVLWLDIAKAFGKGRGFGLGLLLFTPIFGTILALSDAQYVGPNPSPGRTGSDNRLGAVIALTLVAALMVLGFFVFSWFEDPFIPSDFDASEARNFLTASEIMQGGDDAQDWVGGASQLVMPAIRSRLNDGETYPFFHRLVVLVPVFAVVLGLLAWAYYLKLLAHETALVVLTMTASLLAVLPLLWQYTYVVYQNVLMIGDDVPERRIDQALYALRSYFSTEEQVVLGAFALAVAVGEYGVFLHNRRQTAPIEETPAMPVVEAVG